MFSILMSFYLFVLLSIFFLMILEIKCLNSKAFQLSCPLVIPSLIYVFNSEITD